MTREFRRAQPIFKPHVFSRGPPANLSPKSDMAAANPWSASISAANRRRSTEAGAKRWRPRFYGSRACLECGERFPASRVDARYSSDRCRKRRARRRED
jgi:hypothetical protein